MTGRKLIPQYGSAIPWPRLREHIQDSMKSQMASLRAAQTLEQLHNAKGQLELLEKMLNLPETLTLIDTEDE